MHEVAIATELIDRAAAAAADYGSSDIQTITIAVGEATHLNPQQLRFTIETLAQDTPVDGATVEIERVAPEAVCECGWEGTPDSLDTAQIVAPTVTCPECGRRLEFTAGRECQLTSVSIPDNSSQTAP